MKYCTYCGSGIDDTASFCSNCGAKTGENNSFASFDTADTYTAPEKNNDENTGILILSPYAYCAGGPDKQATRLWWDVDKGNF